MPYIPHTKQDIHDMLATIGVAKIEDLFAEIPENLRSASLSDIALGITEMELTRLMKDRAEQDEAGLCFIGAGSYEHHIPAAVWEITARGEFMTAYTPYQAEASQGTLQLLYEYQTMMASLMGLDVSNASLYDGGSALAEAVLMALRSNKNSKAQRILMPRNVHPLYRQVVESIVGQQGIQIIEVPYGVDGKISEEALHALSEDVAALVIPQPNFFGVFEDVDTLTDWAHANKALVIAVVNPLAMSFLKPPGQWGQTGADIACGEGQPLGVPMASGGPYYGFLCCKQEFVRQLPGRIVGRTVDKDGKEGFVLTLQAREQHIRRAKATSNICTNQGLLVTASTIHMSLLGPHGLRNVAIASYQNARMLREKLVSACGLKVLFDSPSFHEFVVQLPVSAKSVLKELAKYHIQGGYDLSETYPELENCLLICVTETKAKIDLDEYVDKMQFVLSELSVTSSFQKKSKPVAECEEGEA